MGSREKLADGWIRKESRSRPNNFYYFNTTTGKSQWESPAKANEKSKKEINDAHIEHTKVKTTKYDEKYKSHSTENQSRIKINDKSKERKFYFPYSEN